MDLNEDEQDKKIEQLKMNVREDKIPFFDEKELKYYLEKAGNGPDFLPFFRIFDKVPPLFYDSHTGN